MMASRVGKSKRNCVGFMWLEIKYGKRVDFIDINKLKVSILRKLELLC